MHARLLGLLALALPTTALAAPICHIDGTGTVRQLDVGSSAVSAHLRHGDFTPAVYYRDRDGDGHGDPALAVARCEAAAGYVALGNDLDDTNAAVTTCLDLTGNWWATQISDGVSTDLGAMPIDGTSCSFTAGELVGIGSGSSFTIANSSCTGIVLSDSELEITCLTAVYQITR